MIAQIPKVLLKRLKKKRIPTGRQFEKLENSSLDTSLKNETVP